MGKFRKRWKRKSLYKKSMIIFIVLLIICTLVFLGYVTNTMIEYENSQVNNHIKKLVTSGELAKNIDIKDYDVNKYDKSKNSAEEGLKELLKSSDVKIEKSNLKKGNSYDLYIEDALIAIVTLKKTGSHSKMLILTIDEWEVENIETNFDRGIYYYDVNIPKSYKLYINDKEVKDSYEESDIEGLENLTKYIEINKTRIYKLDNFVSKPEIVIKDNKDKKIDYKLKNNKIEITKEFKKYDSYDEVKKELNGEIDVLKLAKNWSLFLTDDLKGPWHGFTLLTPYLINESYMYQMAYNWSHNVDITFVSSHSLKNPVFTNEKVKNCTVYNENAFSCEVYLEKNMIVNGQDKTDIMHDYLYFINYEGGWKLVDMKAVTK